MSVLDFVKWTFDFNNRDFLKKSSPTEISNYYKQLTGTYISPTRVSYNRSRWIRIDGELHERKNLPISFWTPEYKRYAKENGIEIDYGYAI